MRGTGPETHPGQTKETKDQADFNGPGGSLLGLGIFFFFFLVVCVFRPFPPCPFLVHVHRDGRWLKVAGFFFFFFCPKSKSDPTEPLESGRSFVSLI